MKRRFLGCLGAISALTLLISGCTSDHGKTEKPEGLHAVLTADPGSEGLAISDSLFGLFLEDINFAVDAGLYAELIPNRSFEYGSLTAAGARHSWSVTTDEVSYEVVRDENCLNENNPSYAVVTNAGEAMEGLSNPGFLDGLAVTAGESYTASAFIRGTAQVRFSIEDVSGKVYAQEEISADSSDWHQYSVTLTPTETAKEALRFVVRMGSGTVHMDMLSLMPCDTFAGLPIRKDLGQALQALNPSFLRFPGGCAIEGKTEETMYNWKDSIGNGIAFFVNGEEAIGHPATRKQTIDLWNGNNRYPYYCTYGLGFYEYFQLCEALECFAIPVVNAGMTCPIQSSNYKVYDVDSEEFRQCVQDALDLVEFCRGGADTTWGAVRIAMGHAEPFTLKYIGIGNEQWQREYHEHYSLFVEAFEKAAAEQPEIFGGVELIVANGPASGSTEGWEYVRKNADALTTLVDEHYYEPADWFLSNTLRYDSYSRNTSAKVFLGEYAAKDNTLYAALAEAAYMTGLERNGDIVVLACYAPLFGNSTFNQWLPDMIFFSNDSVCLTPNYYVQQLFAANTGSVYLDTAVTLEGTPKDSLLSGKVGLGSWMTSVAYDDLKVVSNSDGSVLYENDFSESSLKDFDYHEGDWAIKDGRLVQQNTAYPYDELSGDALYVGDTGWTDYTLTVRAEILGGDEGFLIPICVENSKNSIFWNIGGWGNTVSCLQTVTGGSKSGQVAGTVRSITLKQGQVYELKVEVSGSRIRCYIDGNLYVNYVKETVSPLYASTVRDDKGDVIIKLVNVSSEAIPVVLELPGVRKADADITVLTGASAGAVNSFDDPDAVTPATEQQILSDGDIYEAPPYSLTVIRIPQK